MTSRKYKAALFGMFQSTGQMTPRLRKIFLGQVAVKLAGGLGTDDAEVMARAMNTTPEFLQAMRRREVASEWALSVRGATEAAVKIAVPLGGLSRYPLMSEGEWQAVLAGNRRRYGAAPAVRSPTRPAPAGEDDEKTWRS